MQTGELRNQVDQLWDSFWTGGIAHPMKVVEEITYPLFMKHLDELQTLEGNKSARTGKPLERLILHAGEDAGCSSEHDYIEQTSCMLFLKYFDDAEAHERAL